MIKSLKTLVELRGFEPLTSALRTQRYSLKLAEYCGFAWLQRVLVTIEKSRSQANRVLLPRRTLRSGVA